MPMPGMQVTNAHGHEIDEIAKLAALAEKPYARQTLTTVVVMFQGIPAETIAQTLGCSRVSVWRYVDRWNRQGIEAATDHGGGSQSSFTEKMPQDIDDAVRNRSPRDHGYSKNRWGTRVLQSYILDTNGKKYSYGWILEILHKHSRKRSTKRSARANKEAQEPFKKGLLR